MKFYKHELFFQILTVFFLAITLICNYFRPFLIPYFLGLTLASFLLTLKKKTLEKTAAENSSNTLPLLLHKTGPDLGTIVVKGSYSFRGSYDLNTISSKLSENIHFLDEGINRNITAAEELYRTSENISHLADNMVEAMETTAQNTTESSSLLGKVDNAINSIKKNEEKTEGLLSEINSVSKKTNMLALNAAIEAAKAGKHGKGFAVVAEEIRKLAEQTANASAQINELIDEGNKRIMEGLKSVELLNEAMTLTITSVKETLEHSNQIKLAMDEHKVATEEITTVSNDLALIRDTILQFPDTIQSILSDLLDTLESITMHSASVRDTWVSHRSGVDNLLSLAQMDHGIWMMKLIQILVGKETLDEKLLTSHHNCRLGKWLDSDGKERFGNHAQWKTMNQYHKGVHENGLAMVNALKENHEENINIYLGKMIESSSEVIRILQLWQNDLSNSEY